MSTVKATNLQHPSASVAAEVERLEATAAAISHARSLGFTDQMISVMYPGLIEL